MWVFCHHRQSTGDSGSLRLLLSLLLLMFSDGADDEAAAYVLLPYVMQNQVK